VELGVLGSGGAATALTLTAPARRASDARAAGLAADRRRAALGLRTAPVAPSAGNKAKVDMVRD